MSATHGSPRPSSPMILVGLICALLLSVASAQDTAGCLEPSASTVAFELPGGTSQIQTIQLNNPCSREIGWQAVVLQPGEDGPRKTVLSLPRTAGAPAGDDAPRVPVAAFLADLDGLEILYSTADDTESPLEFTTLINDLELRGASVRLDDGMISAGLLSGVDILWLEIDYGHDLHTTEQDAIVDWCRGGGSLWLSIYDDGTFDEALLDQLGSGIVELEYRIESGYAGWIGEHAMTQGVESVRLASGRSGIRELSAPAVPVLTEDGQDPLVALAASDVGQGRLVVQCSRIHQDVYIDNVDNQLLANQLVDWLAAKRSWLDVQPAGGHLPPQESLAVSLTADATGFCTDTVALDVWFVADDPATAPVRVSVGMSTTGTPRLQLGTELVDFPAVVVNDTVVAAFTIENVGCEPLTITSLQPQHVDVTVVSGVASVPAGASAPVTLAYHPVDAGPLLSTIIIATDDPETPVETLLLDGLALEPGRIAIDTTGLEHDLLTGEVVVEQLTVSNPGETPVSWLATIDPGQSSLRLADLTGQTILYDRAHGQVGLEYYDGVVGDLESRGAQVTVQSEMLTEDDLVGVSLYWSSECTMNWSETEQIALVNWMSMGGKLILEGDSDAAVVAFQQLLTRLGAGLQFDTTDGTAGLTSQVVPHSTTEDVSSILLHSPGARVGVDPERAIALILDQDGVANTATDGRILIMGDDNFHDIVIAEADNRVFAGQAFDWLLATPTWLTMTPATGEITAGGAMTVNAVIDAAGFCDESLAGTIVFRNLDSGVTEAEVPAGATVAPAPDIRPAPTTMVLGTIEPLATIQRSLTITNDGCLPLTVTGVTCDHPDVSVDPYLGIIAVGQSVVLEVLLNPSEAGEIETAIRIASDDPDLPLVEVPVVATVQAPGQISIQPGSVSVDLQPGSTAERSVTITNDGLGELHWSAEVVVTGRDDALPDRTDQDLSGMVVMFDGAHTSHYHGNWENYMDALAERGASVVINMQPLTPGALDTVDILLCEYVLAESWLQSEIEALDAWLRRGGGLHVGQAYSYDIAGANELLAGVGAGVRLYGLDQSITDGTPVPHLITRQVDNLEFPYTRIGLELAADSGQLMVAADGTVLGAYETVDSGRIVLDTVGLLHDSNFGEMDNRRFGHQAADWLALAGAWLQIDPASGSVAAGESVDVLLSFDSQDLCGTAEMATILVQSDAVDSPTLEISATMNVAAAPFIVVDPGSLAFGEHVVGDDVTLTLGVSNLGCTDLVVTGIETGAAIEVDLTSFSVEPLGREQIALTYRPSQVGDQSGTIQVASDDPTRPIVEIPWTGRGVASPDVFVEPGDLQVVLDDPGRAIRPVTLRNNGDETVTWTVRCVEEDADVLRRLYRLNRPDWPGEVLTAGIGSADQRAKSSERVAELLDLNGVTFGIAVSHGETPSYYRNTIINDLTLRGAEVVVLDNALTPERLAPLDVLWLGDTGSGGLPALELEAVVEYAQAGGDLFIEFRNAESLELSQALFGSIGVGFDLMEATVESGPSQNLEPHPITQGLETVDLLSSSLAFENVTEPASILFRDAAGTPAAAVGRSGSARIVVTTTCLSRDGYIEDAHNQLFVNRALGWLGRRVDWLVPDPAAGVIGPGLTQVMNLTYEAEHLCGEQAQAQVLLSTMDGYDIGSPLPASIVVGTAPSLDLSTTSLDLGICYPGAASTDSFMVFNDGCSPLEVSSIGSDHSDLAVTPGSFTVAPGDSQLVRLTCTPADLGPLVASIDVFSDDPRRPEVAIVVTGQVLPAPALVLDPVSMAVQLDPDETTQRLVQVANPGASPLVWSLTARREGQARPALVHLPGRPGVARDDGGEPLPVQPPLPAVLIDLTDVIVARDLGHGQWSGSYGPNICEDLALRGAGFIDIEQPLSAATLEGVSVLWIHECSVPWGEAEIEAVLTWIRGGGSLLLSGNDSQTVIHHNTLLAGSGAGVMVAVDQASSGETDQIVAHAVTRDVQELWIDYWDQTLAAVEAPALAIVSDDQSEPVVALTKIGFGRIIVAPTDQFDDYELQRLDTRRFANQVFDWLANAIDWLAFDPDVGEVPPGGAMTVNLTIGAQSTCGGDHRAALRFESNDPAMPEADMAVTMTVSGEPEMSLDPLVLAFGAVDVGQVGVDTLRVVNTGCDTLHVSALSSSLPEFQVDGAPLVVPAGSMVPVEVRFSPLDDATYEGQLEVVSDDPVNPIQSVTMFGGGYVQPLATLDADSLVVQVAAGESSTATLELGNLGGSPLEWSLVPEAPGGAGLQPLPDEFGQLDAVRILLYSNNSYDPYNWADLIADLEDHGADVFVSGNDLTESALGQADVLWFSDGSPALSADDVANVAAWARGGGAVLVTMNNAGSAYWSLSALADALDLGMTFSTDNGQAAVASDLSSHPLLVGIEEVTISWSDFVITGVDAGTTVFIRDPAGLVRAAGANVGFGCLYVQAGDAMQQDQITETDNRFYARRLFNWLLRTPNWLTVDPASGVVEAGDSQQVSMIFDPGELCGGTWPMDLRLVSNDPDNPDTMVHTELTIAGSPSISIEPRPLELGTLLVGQSVVDTIQVTAGDCGLLVVSAVESDGVDAVAEPGVFALDQGQSRSVVVSMTPTEPGTIAGSLLVHSNDGQTPVYSLPVHGQAVEPAVMVVQPDAIAVSLSGDLVEQRTVTISNPSSGGISLDWNAWIWSRDFERRRVTLPAPSTVVAAGEDMPARAPGGHDEAAPLTRALADLAGVSILFDSRSSSFGITGYETIVGDLLARGATVNIGDAALTPEELGPHQILWLTPRMGELTPEELSAVVDWVNAGGCIYAESASDVESLNQTFTLLSAGVTIDEDCSPSSGTISDLTPHQATHGVDALDLYWHSACLGTVAAPAVSLARDPSGRHIASASRCGLGRVLVSAEYFSYNPVIPGADNRIFVNQAFDWLARSVSWLSVAPVSGVTPAGGQSQLIADIGGGTPCSFLGAAVIEITGSDPALPMAQVPVDLTVIGNADLDLSTELVDFGQQFIGWPTESQVEVLNSGCGELVVASITCPHPDVSVSPATLVVPPGGAANLTVRLEPTQAGELSTSVALASNDPTEPVVQLPVSGTVAMPPVMAVDPGQISQSMWTGQRDTVLVTLQNNGQADLHWSATAIGDDQPVAAAGAAQARVVERGASPRLQSTEPLAAHPEWLQAASPLLAQGVPLDGPSWLSVEPQTGTIPGGEAVFLNVVLDAGGMCEAPPPGGVIITGNDPATPQLAVVVDLALITGPDLVVEPTGLDMGLAFVGHAVHDTFHVVNEGCELLNVSAIVAPTESISLMPSSFAVEAGESQPVVVTFSPSAPDTLDVALSVHSDDPVEPVALVPISALAWLEPWLSARPDSLSLQLAAGESADREVLLENTGGSSLSWSAHIEGGDSRLQGMSVLFDQAHQQPDPGNWSELLAAITAEGAVVTICTDELTPEALATQDIAWLSEGQLAWSADELAVLVEWVTAGGQLVVEGDSGPIIDLVQLLLNYGGAGLSVIRAPALAGTTDMIIDHAMTTSVETIELPGPEYQLFHANPIISSALVHDQAGALVCAVSQAGIGRIMVVADDLFNDASMALADNGTFARNVFSWMGELTWVSLDAQVGTIEPGQDFELGVGFAAEGVSVGLNQAELVLTTNNPFQPDMRIPLQLYVTDGAVDVELPVLSLDLHNAPNPFNPSTQFRFNLPRAGDAVVQIHDLRGVRVRTIVARGQEAGPAVITWRGDDDNGAAAASGVYVYRLLLDGKQLGSSRKMTLVK